MPTKKLIRRVVKRPAAPTREVAELIVERKKLSELKPHPRNPRTHPKPGSEGWEVLKKSLEHDYFDPMVWNKRNGMLVSGHLRRKVFQSMGIKEADVVIVDYDETTHIARMIAANKAIGEDDTIKLGELIGELGEINEFDFSLAGFTLEEKQRFSSGDADDESEGEAAEYTATDIDKITTFFGKGAKPTVETKIKQVWKVGDNYLYIGSVLADHALYVPLLALLREEFPSRKVLLVPMPDPLMIGHTDTKVAAVFVQPSPLAASLALSILKKRKPSHVVKLINNESKLTKKKSKQSN